ncbi:MAG: hypothetical protein NTU81_00660 [Candidatus Nomurabacteria bacterium]|nr:hypothetical protein [Candidatus Nomurabacteria bacterium]
MDKHSVFEFVHSDFFFGFTVLLLFLISCYFLVKKINNNFDERYKDFKIGSEDDVKLNDEPNSCLRKKMSITVNEHVNFAMVEGAKNAYMSESPNSELKDHTLRKWIEIDNSVEGLKEAYCSSESGSENEIFALAKIARLHGYKQ